MSPVRRFLAPVRIALIRLRARVGRASLVMGGVAVSAAGVALVLGGGLIARDRAFARALAEVPAVDRAVQVAYFGVPPQGGDYRGSLDPPVSRALAALGAGRPIRAMLYRRTRIGSALVNLGALDGVGRWVRLRSGRLPRRCSPARCEVVQVGRGRAGAIPGVHLVVVGRGELASPLAFGRLLPSAPGSALSRFQFSPEVPPTLLVAEGVSATSALPALESIFRSYLWFVPLRPGSVHAWDSAAFADSVTRVRSTLEARSSLFDITAPSEELAAADDAGRIAERRLLLVGGRRRASCSPSRCSPRPGCGATRRPPGSG